MSQSPLKFLSGKLPGNLARFVGGIGKMSDSELAEASKRYSALDTTGAGQYGLMAQLTKSEMEKRQAATSTSVIGSVAKSEAGEGVRRSGFGGRIRNFFNRPAVEGAASLATKSATPTTSTDLSGIESRLASIEQKLSGSETAMGSVGPTAPPVIEPSLPSAADELGAQY